MARLHEHPLVPLPINDPGYAEFVVHSATPTPDVTIKRVKQWALAQEHGSL
ncbi:hypothetical protein [Streptomyces sp. ME18-1-4]|uniref:hypothetical protein n=1 Tax=Streptomyces sp. ME18-1-4 TaxID=3028685 RepID=UPI0029B8B5BF|nr:hypothetical protein [Streptomyces sp. ME18-1-4]MDX3245314.1 hypothetical protein [Streptomyces sp. ME18-1-4]